jgi:hypothetical protein
MTMTPSVSRRSPLLLLCLLLLAPGLCLAQERPALRLMEDSWHEESAPRSTLGGRIGAELGLGLLSATVVGIGGGLATLGLCDLGVSVSRGGFFGCMDDAVLGAIMGVLVGAPLGVWWGGELMDGNGQLFSAYLGMGAGLLTGLLVATLSPGLNAELFVFGTPVFLLAGTIVGYELSQSERPRLQPVVAVSSRGAMLGLGGHF